MRPIKAIIFFVLAGAIILVPLIFGEALGLKASDAETKAAEGEGAPAPMES